MERMLVALAGLAFLAGCNAGAASPASNASAAVPAPETSTQLSLQPPASLLPPAKPEDYKVSTAGWQTDFSRHVVPVGEIASGGPGKDGIPAIDQPKFAALQEGDAFLKPKEAVVAVQRRGMVKAYPLQILVWHEIINDTIGAEPVTVTFCPLCNTAITFARRLDSQVLDFGTTGNLRNSDLVMYDRQT